MTAVDRERVVLVVAGATATGKTEVGEAVARHVRGEVICADARQVFAELDVGTGKPTLSERRALPHRLFEWRRLGEAVSAGAWAREAAACCEAAFESGRVPVLVGGSGLYLRALIEGLHREPARDPDVRAALERELEVLGVEALHARLQSVDPALAMLLPARDRQRILRALEVASATGRPLSAWHAEPRRPLLAADFRVVEMVANPGSLASRIHARTAHMFEAGLLEETRSILASGEGPALRALRAIGYDEARSLLEGALTLEAAIERTDARTRQLARRQRTWFRHQLTAVPLDTDSVPRDRWVAEALRSFGIAGDV